MGRMCFLSGKAKTAPANQGALMAIALEKMLAKKADRKIGYVFGWRGFSLERT